jgi:phage tail tape-measure protein
MNEISPDAMNRAERDLITQQQIEAARTTEVGTEAAATTGTGTGDNRDETNDSATGAMLGGVGGALAGAAAGALLGPAGAAVGAAIGALTGAGAAGLAVDAVDQVDDDNTLTGLDEGAARDGSNIITPEMRAAQAREAARPDPNRSIDSTLNM